MEKYRKIIMDHCSNGLSPEEILSDLCSVPHPADSESPISVDPELHARFMEHKQEFDNIVAEYQHLVYAWWVAHGRVYLTGDNALSTKKLNFNVWMANMKTRFGWKELGSTVATAVSVKIEAEQINEAIRNARAVARNDFDVGS